MFTSQTELNAIQHRMAAVAADPAGARFAGYLSTTTTRFADVAFAPQVIAHVKRGDSKPVDSPVIQRDSAVTAYTRPLRWAATGDAATRGKVRQVMDAWTHTFEPGFTTTRCSSSLTP